MVAWPSHPHPHQPRAIGTWLMTTGEGRGCGLSPPSAPLVRHSQAEEVSGCRFAGMGLRAAFVSRQFLAHTHLPEEKERVGRGGECNRFLTILR